jgi:hypothetical protein
MAQAGKYGELGIEHVPDGEPVFVIRAQDKAALAALMCYAQVAESIGASSDFVDRIWDQIIPDFREWQRHHDTKTPD